MGIKTLVKRKLPRGVWLALTNLRVEIARWRQHRTGARKAKKLYAGRRGLKLNIGAGQNYKLGWVNIDILQDVDLDLSLDMREPLPLSDGSANLIYSEHFLECLYYPRDAQQFLLESYRILEPGGIFSVGVPDTQWPLMDYAGVGDGKYFQATKSEHWHPHWAKTRLDHINCHFRMESLERSEDFADGGHRYAYDFETLRNVMENAGFVNVRQREFSSAIDNAGRRIGTLYVEGMKPKRARGETLQQRGNQE